MLIFSVTSNSRPPQLSLFTLLTLPPPLLAMKAMPALTALPALDSRNASLLCMPEWT
jgi:hypothetical protein